MRKLKEKVIALEEEEEEEEKIQITSSVCIDCILNYLIHIYICIHIFFHNKNIIIL